MSEEAYEMYACSSPEEVVEVIDRKNAIIARLQALTDAVAKTLDCDPDEIATEATSVYRAWCDDREKIAKLQEALMPMVVNRSFNPEILKPEKPGPFGVVTVGDSAVSIVVWLDDLRRAARVMEETK